MPACRLSRSAVCGRGQDPKAVLPVPSLWPQTADRGPLHEFGASPCGRQAAQNGCPAVLSNPLHEGSHPTLGHKRKRPRERPFGLWRRGRDSLGTSMCLALRAASCAKRLGRRRLSCRFVEPSTRGLSSHPRPQTQKASREACWFMAEREGFEPS